MHVPPLFDVVCRGDRSLSRECPASFIKKRSIYFVATGCSKRSYPQKLCAIFCLPFLLLVTSFSVKAQQETNYAVHANIIYHFTKYIDWPSSVKSGDFTIGIMGEIDLYDELKKNISNKMAGEQRIVVKRISSAEDVRNCQILFIGEDESSSLRKIAAKTAGAPILIVSESDGLAQKGSCINFTIVSDHLKLEINKNNIEQRGLSIASELLKLGKIVK
jgi:hypothetical protein